MTFLPKLWRFLGAGGWLIPAGLLVWGLVAKWHADAVAEGRLQQARAEIQAKVSQFQDSAKAWAASDTEKNHAIARLSAQNRAAVSQAHQWEIASRGASQRADSLLRELLAKASTGADSLTITSIVGGLDTARAAGQSCSVALDACNRLQQATLVHLTEVSARYDQAKLLIGQQDSVLDVAQHHGFPLKLGGFAGCGYGIKGTDCIAGVGLTFSF